MYKLILTFLSVIVLKTMAFGQSTIPPLFEMSYFQDTTSTHSLQTVQQEEFTTAPEQIVSLGFTNSTVWVKVVLNTEALEDETVLMVTRPFLDSITVSYDLINKGHVEQSLGIMYPSTHNKLNHFLPTFEIPTRQLASPVLYLRVKSRWSMLIPITVKNKEAFYKNRVTNYLIGGLLIGGLLVMAVYNLFLYFSTKDSSYFIYVASLLSAILSQGYIFGILIPYLSPDSPEFSFRFPIYIMASNSIFCCWFAIKFLDLKKYSKPFYYLMLFNILFSLFNMGLEFLELDYISRKVNIVQVLSISLFILSAAVTCLVKGNKVALYFTIAWTLYLSGMFVFALKTAGVIPHTPFTAHFMHLGTFMEVMLLSFALGHKYYLIRIEKERLERQTREKLEELVKIQTSKLETSLSEKEILLKEVHHRVKNNLQIVISLLDLQVASIKDAKNKDVLTQSKSRVYSMSLIHQKLYSSDNLARIDMKSYLIELVDYLKNSYYIQSQKIDFSLAIENKEVSLTRAVPLGLIVNELLTNSFKYGISQAGENKIQLTLQVNSENLVLQIADSGKGFVEDKNKQEVKKSLGLFLVKSLTKQLKGTMDRYHENELFVSKLTIPLED